VSTLKVQTIQHTNGTSGMTIDSGGRVNMPKIPCCMARLTTSNAQDGSNPYTSTGVDVRFDSILLNQGSCYSESTGRFVAPVAGIYAAECQFLANNSASTNIQFTIMKNGTVSLHHGYNSVDTQYVELHAHALVELAASDYISVRLNQGELYLDNNGRYSSFTVRLIG
tara:strand:+ start:238 stop:741 length:504 start_codon:yes stop_codon:yes gene_type:complete